MNVETKPVPTTPTRPARGGHRGFSRLRLPRRDPHRANSSVVRVHIGRARRLYAYRVQGVATVGDRVAIDTPHSGTLVTPVVALGRGGYVGPLQTAILIGS